MLSRYFLACPSSPARRPPPAPPTPTGCSSGYPGTPLPQRCGCRRNPVRLPLRYSRGSAAEPNCSAPEPECLQLSLAASTMPESRFGAVVEQQSCCCCISVSDRDLQRHTGSHAIHCLGIGVCTSLQQHAHNFGLVVFQGYVKRCATWSDTPLVGVGVCAVVQKQLCDFHVSASGSYVKRCKFSRVLSIGVCALLQVQLYGFHIAPGGSVMQGQWTGR